MTYDQALSEARTRLTKHTCEGTDAAHEAIDLLLLSANITREKLFLLGRDRIPAKIARKYQALIGRRLRHTPLAHLLGSAFFMGRTFAVTKATLIPRPATELILEQALTSTPNTDLIIDVGTGSGCIAVSMSLALPHATTLATDISTPALRIARKNARTHHAPVIFKKGNLLTPILNQIKSSTHALIIANLPYIPALDYKKLSLDIRRNEPRSALIGGKDGLDPYRKLLAQIATLQTHQPALSLPKGITLVCEILPCQLKKLESLVEKKFPSATTSPIKTGDEIIIGTITTIPLLPPHHPG